MLLPAAVEHALRKREPFFWINDRKRPFAQARLTIDLHVDDVQDAERRFSRFASLLVRLFPELQGSGGIIESPLQDAAALQKLLIPHPDRRCGRWLVKGDHALPIAGSIKARGGIYEVLVHAERVALQAGLIKEDDHELLVLASPSARERMAQHQVVVGSTGNLGLSIGIMAVALGFRATVHMSADAKQWKKTRLRARGVEVIEHDGDFGAAVAAGREQARRSPHAYFVDDENSEHLFLGYSVAALRLQQQLLKRRVQVDARHPLFVYIPCGVGGAPSGITLGLHHLFGDDVHCFFAEPVSAPCMLVRLAALQDRPLSVRDIGLDNHTEADGLAVAQASEFASRMVRSLVSGVFTVAEDAFFQGLYALKRSMGLRIEPSAAAAFGGPSWLLESAQGRQYVDRHGLADNLVDATHVLWTTGGAFVPDAEYRKFHEHGRRAWLLRQCRRPML